MATIHEELIVTDDLGRPVQAIKKQEDRSRCHCQDNSWMSQYPDEVFTNASI